MLWTYLFNLDITDDSMKGPLAAMSCVGNRGEQINKEQKKASRKIEKSLEEDKKKYNSTHRLLLLGKKFIIYKEYMVEDFSLSSKCRNFQKKAKNCS